MMTTLALLGSMLGSLLLAKHMMQGYYVWIVANILWLVDSVGRGDVQQSVLWVFYLVTCFIGIKYWRNK